MKALLDFSTPDTYVATKNCKDCLYKTLYDMKASLSAKYADGVGTEMVKNLDIYYPRKKT